MAAAAGPNAGLTYGWASGDTWNMNVNWNLLDAEFMLAIISMTLTAPPTSPAAGDRYWIASGSTPTGAWAGQAGTLARYTSAGAWEFFTLKEGTICRLRADNRVYSYDGGGNWLAVTPQVSQTGTLASSFGARQLDFQNGFKVTDAGSGYFQISLTGSFSQGLTFTNLQGTAKWLLDLSDSTNRVAIANGSYTSLVAGCGLFFMQDLNTNNNVLFMVGGGAVVIVAQNGSLWSVSSSPAAGQYGLYYSSSSGLYTMVSNRGGATTVVIVPIVRTLTTA